MSECWPQPLLPIKHAGAPPGELMRGKNIVAAAVGTTSTSFSFWISGGETGVGGGIELAGSTTDSVDFVQTTVPIEIAVRSRTHCDANLDFKRSPTVAPTAVASAPLRWG